MLGRDSLNSKATFPAQGPSSLQTVVLFVASLTSFRLCFLSAKLALPADRLILPHPPIGRRNAGVMVPFTFAPTDTLLATYFSPLISPSCVCAIGTARNAAKVRNFRPLSLKVAFGKEIGSGFSIWGFSSRRKRGSGYSCFCEKGWDSEGDLALELEILKFMKDSKKPESFPRKKELVDAGRMDLVDGIRRQGGWITLGWDLDSKEELKPQQKPNYVEKLDFSPRGNSWDDGEVGSFGASSFALNSSSPPSSSGRSL